MSARAEDSLLLVTAALACEARPLVAALDLVAAGAGGPFRIFRGETAALVVTGVGRAASAAGTAYLGALVAAPVCAWINVGTGGHAHLEPGTVRVAHEVEDALSGRRDFPPRTATEGLASARVRTVDRVETEWRTDAICEMEAAAFLETARRFSLAELVQVVKVVSDGPGHPVERLDADRIADLVAAAVPVVEELASRLRLLTAALATEPRDELAGLAARWHLTVTQQRRLARLLTRYRALAVSGAADRGSELDALLAECGSGREALARLEDHVDAMPVRLGGAPA